MKVSKRWKKHLEISPFYTSVPKIMIICYTVPEIWHVTYVIFIFHFGLFFALLPSNSSKNKNFKTRKKNTWRYHQFTHGYQKLWLDAVRFLRYGAYYILWRYYILHNCTKNSWSYGILFLRYGTWHMSLLFFILGYVLPFYPLTA